MLSYRPIKDHTSTSTIVCNWHDCILSKTLVVFPMVIIPIFIAHLATRLATRGTITRRIAKSFTASKLLSIERFTRNCLIFMTMMPLSTWIIQALTARSVKSISTSETEHFVVYIHIALLGHFYK